MATSRASGCAAIACAWYFPQAPKPASANRTGEAMSVAGRGSEWGHGVRHETALPLVETAGGQPGQHVFREEVALVEVRVAAQDEGANAHVHIALQFRQ